MRAKPNFDCPLCGGPNDCAAAASGSCDTPCWCAAVAFSPELIARVPPELAREACICRACAQAHPRPGHFFFDASATSGVISEPDAST
jgi:hypothetical protein